ncbi:MAG: SDR family oxidoreductase [Gemmatimonadales bacterium]
MIHPPIDPRPPVALVTGATEDIGRATAFALGRAGFALGVTARTAAKVDDLLAALRSDGIEAAGIPADVGEPADVERLAAHVAGALGPVHTLVNNAGVLIPKPFLEQTLDEWDTTFRTNVRSLYLVTRAVLPGMIAAGEGDVVNVASLAGKNPVRGAAAYSASKHAVLGLSRTLMLELRHQGIRVIAVCPGSVDTPMMRGQDTLNPKLDRILKPEDVAAAVLSALQLPRRATPSEIDIRPSDP